MRKSIRLSLIHWTAAVLLSIVGGYAYVMYSEVRRARMGEVDAELLGAVNYIDSTLRQFPPYELDPRAPKLAKGPLFKEGKEGKGPPPPPKGPNLEQLMANLPPPGWPAKDDRSERYFAVFRDNGTTLFASNFPKELEDNADRSFSPIAELNPNRGSREATIQGPYRTRVVVGRKLESIETSLAAFARKLALFGGAFVAVGLLGGWWISSRIVRPLKRISKSASRISATNLSERIVADHIEAELAPLAGVLNATFDRLEAAFGQLTRFTADASHELRTPLAIIKANLELALARPRSSDEYRETLQTCLKSTTRMTQLVEGLLTLARSDAGQGPTSTEPVRLDTIVAEAIQQLQPIARKAEVTIEHELQPVSITGDEPSLLRVALNVIENAIRYNREGGSVQIRLVEKEGKAVLRIRDTGEGIALEEQKHVFERFFRADRARTRNPQSVGGNGLGLAICKSIVESHGGTIVFESVVGKGTTFRIRFPIRKG